MVRRSLTFTTLITLSVAGCYQSSSTSVDLSAGSADPAGEMSTVDVDSVAADAADTSRTANTADVAPESAPTPDRPVAAISTKRSSQPEVDFVPPFPENVDFFSPPALAPAEPNAAREAVGTEATPESVAADAPLIDLRVIGFVQVAGEPPRALLHLDGKLEIVAAGDEVGEVRIVEVREPHVSAMRDGESLLLALNESLNAEQVAAEQPHTNRPSRRRGPWSRSGEFDTNHEAGALPVPVDTDSLPGVPQPPAVDIPEIDLPDVPQLMTVPLK